MKIWDPKRSFWETQVARVILHVNSIIKLIFDFNSVNNIVDYFLTTINNVFIIKLLVEILNFCH